MVYLNAVEAAERASVRPSTVTRWVKSGRLPAERRPTGELQISVEDLDAFLARRGDAPSLSASAAAAELAAAQARIASLEELVAEQRGWLAEANARLHQALLALPPATPPRRPWRPWLLGFLGRRLGQQS